MTIKKNILLFVVLSFLSIKINAQTVTDIDGNVYETIQIGTQTWTRQNLKVTHYLNGDNIPNVTDSVLWSDLTSGAYCNYDNDSNNTAVYGCLYNWYTIQDPRNIAPLGWHVPTYEDLDILQIFLDYDLVAGGKLKEIGTAHWMSPNTGATDEYDFTALPGGQRADPTNLGMFSEITEQGYWWSSSEMDTVYPWGINISYNSEGMTNWAASTKKAGFSIRLIRDTPLEINEINKSDCFNIYPNPAIDYFIIDYSLLSPMSVFVRVYNFLGSEVLAMDKGIQSAGPHVFKFETINLSPGVYILKFERGTDVITKKIIVTK